MFSRDIELLQLCNEGIKPLHWYLQAAASSKNLANKTFITYYDEVEGRRNVSYKEFNTQANKLARYFLKLWGKKTRRVAFYDKSKFTALLSDYALWKIGMATVCVDPTKSLGEIEGQLKASKTNIILTAEKLPVALQGIEVTNTAKLAKKCKDYEDGDLIDVKNLQVFLEKHRELTDIIANTPAIKELRKEVLCLQNPKESKELMTLLENNLPYEEFIKKVEESNSQLLKKGVFKNLKLAFSKLRELLSKDQEFTTFLQELRKLLNIATTHPTSGSRTGEPSPCPHTALAQSNAGQGTIKLIEELQRLGSKVKFCNTTNRSFDPEMNEKVTVAMLGGEVVIPGKDVLTDIEKKRKFITEEGINILQVTPTLLDLLLADKDWVPPEIIICGGEKLGLELIKRVWERGEKGGRDCVIYDFFGTTEATVYSNAKRYKKGVKTDKREHMEGTETFVLVPELYGDDLKKEEETEGEDDDKKDGPHETKAKDYIEMLKEAILDKKLSKLKFRKAGSGEKGLIAIVGRGVEVNPKQVGEKYIEYPTEYGVWAHVTGDLGVINSKGKVQHLSRIDAQVKVQGVRMSLAEGENLVSSHPDVSCAKGFLFQVVPNPSKPDVGDEKIMAVQPRDLSILPYFNQKSRLEEELNTMVAKKFSGVRRPRIYLVSDKYNVGTSSEKTKFNIKAIEKDYRVERESWFDRVLQTAKDLEDKLRAIWSIVMRGYKKIDWEEELQYIGGDSLVYRRFEQEIELRTNFRGKAAGYIKEDTTIKQLVKMIISSDPITCAEKVVVSEMVDCFSDKKTCDMAARAVRIGLGVNHQSVKEWPNPINGFKPLIMGEYCFAGIMGRERKLHEYNKLLEDGKLKALFFVYEAGDIDHYAVTIIMPSNHEGQRELMYYDKFQDNFSEVNYSDLKITKEKFFSRTFDIQKDIYSCEVLMLESLHRLARYMRKYKYSSLQNIPNYLLEKYRGFGHTMRVISKIYRDEYKEIRAQNKMDSRLEELDYKAKLCAEAENGNLNSKGVYVFSRSKLEELLGKFYRLFRKFISYLSDKTNSVEQLVELLSVNKRHARKYIRENELLGKLLTPPTLENLVYVVTLFKKSGFNAEEVMDMDIEKIYNIFSIQPLDAKYSNYYKNFLSALIDNLEKNGIRLKISTLLKKHPKYSVSVVQEKYGNILDTCAENSPNANEALKKLSMIFGGDAENKNYPDYKKFKLLLELHFSICNPNKKATEIFSIINKKNVEFLMEKKSGFFLSRAIYCLSEDVDHFRVRYAFVKKLTELKDIKEIPIYNFQHMFNDAFDAGMEDEGSGIAAELSDLAKTYMPFFSKTERDKIFFEGLHVRGCSEKEFDLTENKWAVLLIRNALFVYEKPEAAFKFCSFILKHDILEKAFCTLIKDSLKNRRWSKWRKISSFLADRYCTKEVTYSTLKECAKINPLFAMQVYLKYAKNKKEESNAKYHKFFGKQIVDLEFMAVAKKAFEFVSDAVKESKKTSLDKATSENIENYKALETLHTSIENFISNHNLECAQKSKSESAKI